MFLLNYAAMLSQKEVSSEMSSLFHPDSKMADMKVHVESSNGAS